MPDETVASKDSIEAASTGRSKCRACKKAIDKGTLRFAESAPNPMTEGETKHYFHPWCAAERRGERMKAFLEQYAEPLAERDALLAAATLSVENPRVQRLGQVERASSGRAQCRHCRELIGKNALRVALQPMEEGRPASWGFVHAECARGYAGVQPSVARLQRASAELPQGDWEELALALTKEVPAAPRPDEAETTAENEAER
jgi:poly(ADP-ribose) polymerase-like protein